MVLLLEEAPTAEAGRVLGALGMPPFAPSTRAGTGFSTLGLYERLNDTALAHVQAMHGYDLILYQAAKVRYQQTVAAFAAHRYFPRPAGRRGRRVRISARA